MVKNTKSKSWWSVMLDDIFILHPDCFLFAKKHCTFSVLENWSNCLEKLTTTFFLWLCKLNHQPFGRLQCNCCVQEKPSHTFLKSHTSFVSKCFVLSSSVSFWSATRDWQYSSSSQEGKGGETNPSCAGLRASSQKRSVGSFFLSIYSRAAIVRQTTLHCST